MTAKPTPLLSHFNALRIMQVGAPLHLDKTSSSISSAEFNCAKLFEGPQVRHDVEVWLEHDGKRRQEFIHEQNGKAFKALKNLDYDETSKLLEKIMDVPKTLASVQLRNKSTLSIHDQGISKPKEVVITKPNGARDVLFNTFDWSRSGTFNFVRMSLSPGERYVTVTAADSGTIDDFKVIIYDLYNRNFLAKEIKTKSKHAVEVAAVHETSVAWLSETQFATSAESGISVFDIKEGQKKSKVEKPQKLDGQIAASNSKMTILNTNGQTLIYELGKPLLTLPEFDLNTIIGSSGNDIYLLGHGAGLWGEVIKVSRHVDDLSKAEAVVIAGETDYVTSKARLLDPNHIALMRNFGADRRVDILDLTTNQISNTFSAPPSSDVANINWQTLGETVELTLPNVSEMKP